MTRSLFRTRAAYLAIVAVALALSGANGRVRAGENAPRLTVVVDRSDLGTSATHYWGEVSDLAVAPRGNLFIADEFVAARPEDLRCQVRERMAATGAIRVVAGSVPGEVRAGETPAQRLALSSCQSLAVGANDDVYLISARFPWGQHPLQLFRISAGSGAVRVLAGCARCYGFHPGRPATQSSVDFVMDLAVDRSGNVLLPDEYTGMIWSLTPHGVLKRVAKNVCSLRANPFACPVNIAAAKDGMIYFDGDQRLVESLAPTTQRISVVAGGGACLLNRRDFCGNHVLATKARLSMPRDLIVDILGNLFVVDDSMVQRVDARTHRISIVAGNDNIQSPPSRLRRGESLPALTTAISPQALAIGPGGAIFIAEEGAGAVLELR